MSVVDDLDYENSVPKRIRFYRNLAKLRQSDLARRAKLSQSAIGQIETGGTMPSMKTLFRIARALNTKPHMLLIPLIEDHYR